MESDLTPEFLSLAFNLPSKIEDLIDPSIVGLQNKLFYFYRKTLGDSSRKIAEEPHQLNYKQIQVKIREGREAYQRLYPLISLITKQLIEKEKFYEINQNLYLIWILSLTEEQLQKKFEEEETHPIYRKEILDFRKNFKKIEARNSKIRDLGTQ